MSHLAPDDPSTDGFFRLPGLLATVGLRRSTIYDLVRKGRFPAPVKLTAHASGWRKSAVLEWLKSPSTWRATPEGGGNDR